LGQLSLNVPTLDARKQGDQKRENPSHFYEIQGGFDPNKTWLTIFFLEKLSRPRKTAPAKRRFGGWIAIYSD
jgi:hypothetical protein